MADIERDITDTMDMERISRALMANPGMNFVQRILHPEQYPSLPVGDGVTATHRMASAEADGKGYAYPTVVQMPDGKLVALSPDEAWEYAMQNRERIEFADPAEADWFARNYKKVWGK